jgi:ABC-type glutathione transport system ATPase component
VARAFLRDAPLLILDEPTSSIDSKTETVILDALERLIEGRTTFMVAHRLSTVRDADLILVVNHGRIAELGTHSSSWARGLYKELHVPSRGRARARHGRRPDGLAEMTTASSRAGRARACRPRPRRARQAMATRRTRGRRAADETRWLLLSAPRCPCCRGLGATASGSRAQPAARTREPDPRAQHRRDGGRARRPRRRRPTAPCGSSRRA